MLFKTHLAFGITVALAVHTLFPIDLIFIIALFVGTITPDIDIQTSKVGKKVKGLSWFIQGIFGHRGLFHSPIIPIIVLLVLYSSLPLLAMGFAIGYGAHLVLDSFTKRGVRWLWPLRWKLKGPVVTGRFEDWAMLAGFVAASLTMLFLNFF